MGEARLRYFCVYEPAFLRGTVRPPHRLASPLVTPPGVACFGVSLDATQQIGDRERAYGRDPRYLDASTDEIAAAEHARHFLEHWGNCFYKTADPGPSLPHPVSVAAIQAQDLCRGWPPGHGGRWLHRVLEQMVQLGGTYPVSLGHYLDRHPSGPLGTPGPSAGGRLGARPHGSDLFDRCRAATEILERAVEQRDQLDAPGRRCVGQMTRHLLRAQQVDWSFVPGHETTPDAGLLRSLHHLDAFYELGGLLLAGRLDLARLEALERGPSFLPEIDLDQLAGG
jgi:1,4-alpha-glucan branching enzyme